MLRCPPDHRRRIYDRYTMLFASALGEPALRSSFSCVLVLWDLSVHIRTTCAWKLRTQFVKWYGGIGGARFFSGRGVVLRMVVSGFIYQRWICRQPDFYEVWRLKIVRLFCNVNRHKKIYQIYRFHQLIQTSNVVTIISTHQTNFTEQSC